MVRKVVRRRDPQSKPLSDSVREIYFQHADGTVDKNDAPDVVGGVMYMTDQNRAPVHFYRDAQKD